MDKEKLIKTIIDSAYNVRLQLGPGFLESVYKNALVLELEKHDITCETEYDYPQLADLKFGRIPENAYLCTKLEIPLQDEAI